MMISRSIIRPFDFIFCGDSTQALHNQDFWDQSPISEFQ